MSLRRKLQKVYRQWTAGGRALPEFIIVGAQKAGTTSLYDYLSEHPQILPASVKEVHYFDKKYHRGEEHYRSYFPKRSQLDRQSRAQGRRVITGEASPYYMYHPHAMKRVADDLPDVKLIIMLREPVDRAYSQYHHELRHGHESREIEEAFAEESVMVDRELLKLMNDEFYRSHEHQHHTYVSRGYYADQVGPILERFPRENILIIESSKFFSDARGETNRTLEFLGLEPMELAEYGISNQGRKRDKLDDTLRTRLREHYAPYNERLFKLLGERFDW